MPGSPAGSAVVSDVDLVRQRVLNVVGHELRTPVTTLRGLARQLASADPDEVQRTLAPAIERSAARLEGLLDDLLVAAGITTALPVDPAGEIDLRTAVEAAWAAAQTGHSHLDIEADATARAGYAVVTRALTHLLANAARHGDGAVRVRLGRLGTSATVDIENGGEPVAALDLEHALELFYRGVRAVSQSPGLGVGLPAARGLVRSAGGELTLRAREGGGMIARVEVPCG